MIPAITTEGLSISRGGEAVIPDFTFNAAPGSWVGLLGPNGSGKTTVLMAIAGRLPVDSGHLWLNGRECSRDAWLRASAVGYAPPPESLPNLLSGWELLCLLGRLRASPPDAPRSIFDALRLDQLLDRSIEGMSSGMRQRLAIFCAFVGGRPIIVLDEPFNWLDPVVAFDLKDAITDAVAAGTLVLTALHDIGTFATRCSSGVWLREGRIAKTFLGEELQAAARDLVAFERGVYEEFHASG